MKQSEFEKISKEFIDTAAKLRGSVITVEQFYDFVEIFRKIETSVLLPASYNDRKNKKELDDTQMLKFIKLTDAISGRTFELNIFAIRNLPNEDYVDKYDDGDSYTRLPLIGMDFPLEVKETPTEIKQLLGVN